VDETASATNLLKSLGRLDVASTERAEQLAAALGLPFDDLGDYRVEPELFRFIPVELMLRYQFVPLHRSGDAIVIAMVDPSNLLAVDEIELALGAPVEVRVGPQSRIAEILEKSESTQRVLDEATEDFRIQLVQERENGDETLSIDRITADTSPIIKLVDTTIYNAIQRRASDIHIETRDLEVIVKYRIDGVLYQAMEPIDKRHHATIVSRIKVMSELDIAERRIPQDGRFKLRLRGRTIDFRVSIMPTVHGEDVVIRILDKESANKEFRTLNLDVLGFDEETKRKLRKFIREPYGMVLVTGPTGSGKTTTLYSALTRLNTTETNIMTAEDPVEYNLPGINQVQMKAEIGLNFAVALRSFLRQDPDIIMVGEIRDYETAEIAIKAALTGHLVLSTLHTNDAPSTISRLLNMGVEPFLVSASTNVILAQRLARRVCQTCKEPAPVPSQVLLNLGFSTEEAESIVPVKGKGCMACSDTGYKGRVALYEVMLIQENIKEGILQGASVIELRELGRKNGMRTLREAGLQKIREGMTSLEEILRVTTGS
jgi:type IV pilus assembly protein PilB